MLSIFYGQTTKRNLHLNVDISATNFVKSDCGLFVSELNNCEGDKYTCLELCTWDNYQENFEVEMQRIVIRCCNKTFQGLFFRSISGGSVLRMFDNVLGRDVFQGGLRNYLEQLWVKLPPNMSRTFTQILLTHHRSVFNSKFGSGSEDVMFAAWDALVSPDQLGGFTFTEIAKSWTNIPGFPVLRVRRDSSTNTMTITQVSNRLT